MNKRYLKEAYDLEKFPDFVNDKLDGVKVELTDLDSGERNFTLKLTGNSANFEKAKETIKDLMSDLHGEYSVVGGDKDNLKYSADKKGNFKLSAGKHITSVVNKILEGADIRQALSEASEEKYALMNDIIKKIEVMPADEFVLNFVDTADKEKLTSDLDSGFLPFNIKGKDMELSLKDGRLEYDGTSMGGSREFYFKVKEIEQELKSIIGEDA